MSDAGLVGGPADESPRRGRRGVRWLIAVVVLLALLAGAVVVADIVIRGIAQDQVAAGIEEQLPAEVEGEVAVEIGGFSVIQQYLAGSFDEVDLSAPALTVSGFPASAEVALRGIPIDRSGTVTGTIDRAVGTVTIPQGSVAGLIASRGVEGDITLGDGDLQYRTSTTILGQEIGFGISARPVIDTGRIVFAPQSAQIDGAGFDFDATQLLNLVVPEGLSVCVAQYLPEAIELRSVEIVGSAAIVDLAAQDLSLDGDALARTGVCN